MDFEKIHSIGQKTSRIIEIEEILSRIHLLANQSLNDDESFLAVTIGKQSPPELFSKVIHGGRGGGRSFPFLWIDEARNMDHSDGIKAVLGLPLGNRGKKSWVNDDNSIRLCGKYQMILVDALTAALKQEQADLNEEVKAQTGNL